MLKIDFIKMFLFSVLLLPVGGHCESGATGTELIKSNFSLIDQNGKQVTHESFYGKYSLIFFGFTNCPNVCPVGLHTLSTALKQLGDYSSSVAPIFITVDPERDTVARMAEYTKYYDERLIGLTGAHEQVEEAAKSFRAYYGKIASDLPGGYAFDHSSIIYLMDTKGNYMAHFQSSIGGEELAKELITILKKQQG